MTYINDIKRAISAVKKPYRQWKDWYNGDVTMLERVFCYEFYHQFRKLMGKPKNRMKYKELYFQGEITKYLEGRTKAPDFVLHSGQDKFINQAVVIEVKTKERIGKHHEECNMSIDIIKLLSLMKKDGLAFKYGVFIGVNCDSAYLKEVIEGEDINTFSSYKDSFNNLYIIGTEDNTPFTLGSLFLSRRTCNQ